MNLIRIDFPDVAYAEGVVTYLHDGKDLGSGAFDINTLAKIRIQLPRFVGVVSALLEVFNESITEELQVFFGKVSSIDTGYDVIEFDIDTNVLGVGLYYLRFSFDTVAGKIYGYKSKSKLRLSESSDIPDYFQMSVVSFSSEYAEEYLGGVIYHIFVDRFYRHGKIKPRHDAVMMKGWEGETPEYPEYPGAHLENNTFFGGTLMGVTEKLDYIKSLGVNLIYLSPIFEAYSNHKYDTGDYMKVDDMFGGDSALITLIKEAKARGIGIILDGVFNHTGADSKYFNKMTRYDTVGAYQSKNSPYFKWYDFQSHPDKYTSWWGIEILPRIHPDVSECGEFIAGEGGVIDKYAALGIAGMRLDVADELSDEFLSKIKSRLCSRLNKNILIGEVWEDGSNKIAYGKRKRYYLGSELDAVMNYPYRVGIISYLRDKTVHEFEYALTDVTFNAPKRVRDMQMNLLGTHDTERIITILAGKSAEGKSNDTLAVTFLDEDERKLGVKLVKLAYTILATLPGIPTVFYGDEVGLEGYKDPFNRRPYPWDNPDVELREHYVNIGKIRRSTDVYRDGDFKLISLTPEHLIFERTKGSERYVTIVNNSDKILNIEFSGRVKDLLSEKTSKKHAICALCASIFNLKLNENYEIT